VNEPIGDSLTGGLRQEGDSGRCSRRHDPGCGECEKNRTQERKAVHHSLA
jgi:hypothetical protein